MKSLQIEDVTIEEAEVRGLRIKTDAIDRAPYMFQSKITKS